jgi:hypothetical protein
MDPSYAAPSVLELGMLFGMAIYMQLKNLPVHRSMREISELIYETCKTYLVTQGKFLMLLWAFIAVVIVALLSACCRTKPCACPSFWLSAWSASPAATAWRGSAFASTPSPTRAPPSPDCAASRIPDLPDSAARRHEHRHDADQRRAAHHADAFCCSFPAITPGPASSASPSANRSARPRCVSPAASSPRSPTSAPT